MKVRALGVAAAMGMALYGGTAEAAPSGNESTIIGIPNEHPDYHLEIEPHGLIAFGGPFNTWHGNLGAGVRASIPLIGNGPIPSINNNLALGFGGDFFVGYGAVLFAPVVAQWNLFLLSHFSMFLEAGVAFTFGNRYQNNSDVWVGPVLGLGGRYHFTERLALTVRLEYPALAVGLSIYL
jgi:hypothetical protein